MRGIHIHNLQKDYPTISMCSQFCPEFSAQTLQKSGISWCLRLSVHTRISWPQFYLTWPPSRGNLPGHSQSLHLFLVRRRLIYEGLRLTGVRYCWDPTSSGSLELQTVSKLDSICLHTQLLEFLLPTTYIQAMQCNTHLLGSCDLLEVLVIHSEPRNQETHSLFSHTDQGGQPDKTMGSRLTSWG